MFCFVNNTGLLYVLHILNTLTHTHTYTWAKNSLVRAVHVATDKEMEEYFNARTANMHAGQAWHKKQLAY